MQSLHTIKAVAASLAANATFAMAMALCLSPAAYAGDLDPGYPLYAEAQAQPVQLQPQAPATATTATTATTANTAMVRVSTDQSPRAADGTQRAPDGYLGDFESNYPQFAQAQAKAAAQEQAKLMAQGPQLRIK